MTIIEDKAVAKARFASTVGGWGDPDFLARVRKIAVPPALDKLPREPFSFKDEFALFMRVLQAAWSEDVLLLYSSRGYTKPELLATAVIGTLLPKRKRPILIFYGEMFEPNKGFRHQLERFIMKLANRAVTRFAVDSAAEIPYFARAWGVNVNKIQSTGFFNKKARPGVDMPLTQCGQHIFAGGTSFRDFDPLIKAARQLPDRQFVICTNRLDGRQDLPANVQAGLVSPAEYDDLIATAAAVVVPLQKGLHRSTGMITFLEAMWSKKLVIVSDASGVREYVEDCVTGLVVDGDADSFVNAIRWVFSPENESKIIQIRQQAHFAVLEKFTVAAHAAQLLAVIDEAISVSNTASV